jgi:hypothetical protein
LSIIREGSIEIIRGVGQNSTSEGYVFTAADAVDDENPGPKVKKLTGATIAEAKANPHAQERGRGVFAATDKDGKQATVKIWSTE